MKINKSDLYAVRTVKLLSLICIVLHVSIQGCPCCPNLFEKQVHILCICELNADIDSKTDDK